MIFAVLLCFITTFLDFWTKLLNFIVFKRNYMISGFFWQKHTQLLFFLIFLNKKLVFGRNPGVETHAVAWKLGLQRGNSDCSVETTACGVEKNGILVHNHIFVMFSLFLSILIKKLMFLYFVMFWMISVRFNWFSKFFWIFELHWSSFI